MHEADLHVHSCRSDGIHTPAEVVAMCAAAGLRAMALTDHDTIDGIDEARAAAPPGFEVIPGIEISSSYRGREIHLLAYFIDDDDRALRGRLAPFLEERRARAERVVERLNGLGVGVTMEEVREIASAAGAGSNSSIGRPHIADAIVRRGAARDIDDAFDRFLRRGRPAYIARACIPVPEAVRLVRGAAGALVVAHPGLNLGERDTRALASEGLDGIEVWHPKHSVDQTTRLDRLARRLGLLATGGSDFHGAGRNQHALAAAGVPLEIVERLRRQARSSRP